ncbi:family 1 putative carbohydrate esterase [Podospora australis]|uniref:Carboxylic ester hydrolase n=1 Tax=Podospora australis TaxID=1536484 RepID=A0AAN7ABN4_9PEZI|nr:family 1 putative carbohydrate esterase [Podospora australis]
MHLLPSLLALLPALASAASLTRIAENFGPNPRNVGFYIYVPDKLAAKPAVLVNPHWCHGTAQAAFSGSQYATLANQHGFIVIYPNSPNTADQCWDVSSKETLTHDGGGDSQGIVSMVKWTLNKYNGDASRVFVTGVSSGAMMTQVLLGSYPDVFAAGSAFSGVPFSCFAPTTGSNAGQYGYWNDDCAKGRVTNTPEGWAAKVKAAYPGYDGWRPKLQLFHGTNDEILDYKNHQEAVKQWAAVLEVGQTPVSVVQNTPIAGWTKSVYGEDGWLEAYSAAGVPHDIRVQEPTVMAFFQLNCAGSNCFKWGDGDYCDPTATSSGSVPVASSTTVNASSSRTSSVVSVTSTSVGVTSSTTSSTVRSSTLVTSTTSRAASTTTQAGGQTLWGQCGGNGWTGATACATGGCTTYNPYYAQCVPTPGAW